MAKATDLSASLVVRFYLPELANTDQLNNASTQIRF